MELSRRIVTLLATALPVALGALGLAPLLPGCAAPASVDVPPEHIESARSSIIAGIPSDAAQDFAVMLVFAEAATSRREICTAALIAPRLVVTARHCVAETDADVGCAIDGKPVRGGVVHAAHDPRKLSVYVGRDRPRLDDPALVPAGRGIEVLDDGGGNLCNDDLALVLLEQPIAGVPIAPLRLEGDVESGERLATIGWGVTKEEVEPAHRQQRLAVPVTRVGPNGDQPIVTPNEFIFGESICLGDSGGPILAEASGAIVGVVSRGGNGTPSGADLASSCVAATNLGTKIRPFRELILRGFAKAGAEPQLEKRVAAPAPEDDGGCSVALTGAHRPPLRSHGSPAWLLGLALAVGVALRRRAHCAQFAQSARERVRRHR